ncbi:MAG: PDZ domain-containing protein [Desulfobacterota bacterium]|nr:PDZ domain-containing protein [Thermodesulfobacteriota bacterium]
MGVSIQELTPELAETFGAGNVNGVLITDVISGSPAHQAGLKPGDIVTKFNGKQINKMQDLSRLVSMTPIGKSVKIEVIREKEKKIFSVVIKEKEETKKLVAEKEEPNFGFQVEEITPDFVRRFGLSETEPGVIVTEVEPGGLADQAGVKVGDIIKEIDKKVINSTKDFREACQSASPEKGVLIFLTRKEGSLFLVLKEK